MSMQITKEAVNVDRGVDVDAHGDIDQLCSVRCLLCSRLVGNTTMSKTKNNEIFGRVSSAGCPGATISEQAQNVELHVFLLSPLATWNRESYRVCVACWHALTVCAGWQDFVMAYPLLHQVALSKTAGAAIGFVNSRGSIAHGRLTHHPGRTPQSFGHGEHAPSICPGHAVVAQRHVTVNEETRHVSCSCGHGEHFSSTCPCHAVVAQCHVTIEEQARKVQAVDTHARAGRAASRHNRGAGAQGISGGYTGVDGDGYRKVAAKASSQTVFIVHQTTVLRSRRWALVSDLPKLGAQVHAWTVLRRCTNI